MQKKLGEIAELIGGKLIGDADIVIRGACGLKEAQEGDISFIANPRYEHLLESTRASAVITSKDIQPKSKAVIITENPSLAFTKVVSLIAPRDIPHPRGIHKAAITGKNVTLGKGTALGAYSVVEDYASIGDGSVVYPGCYIGQGTSIGKDCVIYPNVSIRENITIGSRVIIHSGCVIGSDGFGFVNVEGVHHKIPQTGTVEVGDDVELGANVTIDRARFGKTIIGKGTKIDNLVQIAHNVVIGENCVIVAQVGIAGSATIGKNVILAGQAGVAGHINIGDNAIVMGQAGATKSIPANTQVFGYPAKPYQKAKRIMACFNRLPEFVREFSEMKKELAALCKKKGNEEHG